MEKMTKEIKKESSFSLHKAFTDKTSSLAIESSVVHKRTGNKPKIMQHKSRKSVILLSPFGCMLQQWQ